MSLYGKEIEKITEKWRLSSTECAAHVVINYLYFVSGLELHGLTNIVSHVKMYPGRTRILPRFNVLRICKKCPYLSYLLYDILEMMVRKLEKTMKRRGNLVKIGLVVLLVASVYFLTRSNQRPHLWSNVENSFEGE